MKFIDEEKINTNLLIINQYPPFVPSITELEKSDNPEAIIANWEKEYRDLSSRKDEALQYLLKYVKLCAFLRGMNISISKNMKEHYNWCPYNELVGNI